MLDFWKEYECVSHIRPVSERSVTVKYQGGRGKHRTGVRQILADRAARRQKSTDGRRKDVRRLPAQAAWRHGDARYVALIPYHFNRDYYDYRKPSSGPVLRWSAGARSVRAEEDRRAESRGAGRRSKPLPAAPAFSGIRVPGGIPA